VTGDATGVEEALEVLPLGRVSRERVRRQEARTMEKEVALTGSWVEV
jgi:hypothetical protein